SQDACQQWLNTRWTTLNPAHYADKQEAK
ncbi:MbtH family protein, partial [Salmonella enterica subsp. enterica serovar Anatum]|nr:MbtH family protein [Salmonella enterica subsp. enterica serovar Anatum]MDI8841627.1 MbtH family protein [Salmonella enterica subsp. enterica serovar Anatum]